jgi:hypothetical protein
LIAPTFHSIVCVPNLDEEISAMALKALIVVFAISSMALVSSSFAGDKYTIDHEQVSLF